MRELFDNHREKLLKVELDNLREENLKLKKVVNELERQLKSFSQQEEEKSDSPKVDFSLI